MLFIPFSHYADAIGGPPTFMRNLKRYLDRRAVPYTEREEEGSAAFFPIQYELAALERFKRRGYPLIQRLDGVYHYQRNGWRYWLRNRPIKRIYRSLADYVIFQSDYSRRQCFAAFGAKPASAYTTIVNGVDSSIFYPVAERRAPSRPLRIATSGSFRHLDMIAPVVAALDDLAGELSFELTVVGPLAPHLRAAAARPYVKLAGAMDAPRLAEVLRQSDLYVFCSLNPPCPNALLEAVATGLPVVAFAEGAVPELLSFSPELLAPTPAKLYLRPGEPDPRLLAQRIRLAIERYPEFRDRAREHSRRYDFERCGAAYVQAFEAMGCL